MSTTDTQSGLGGIGTDIRRLRQALTLLPWNMTPQIIALVIASAVTAALDMLAVATMLPLTQMLTGGGEIPSLVQRYVVPIAGTEDRQTLLLGLALLVCAAFVVKSLASIAIRWWSVGVTNRATAALQGSMLRRYVSAPYGSHRVRSKATILQVITGATSAATGGVLLGYVGMVVDLLTIVLLFGTMIVLSPVATLLAVVLFGGTALLMTRVLKPWSIRFAIEALHVDTGSWRSINPAIEGFRETRIFRREDLFTELYAENRMEAAKLRRAQTILGELPKHLLDIVMIVGIFSVAILLFATRPESTAFGLLAVFAAASARIIPALNRLVATYNGIRTSRPSLQLLVQQIDELDEDAARQPVQAVEGSDALPHGDLVVDRVGFRYPDGDAEILSDVSVTIPAGSTIALVGASGAGKTTFADILVGLFDPTSGRLLVEGVDVAGHRREWSERVAMVSQKVYLWEAPLRDLITFGEMEADVDPRRLDSAIERSRLTEFVAGLPDGLDTIIGDSGARVSGGQAQRIGIARALYAEPSILVLDEATSALDNETEYEVTRTIEALHGEITTVVIAHRLSTVKNADEILYFSKGRLKARGTMAELRDSEPEFARLVELGSLS